MRPSESLRPKSFSGAAGGLKRLTRPKSSTNLAFVERWGNDEYPPRADAYELLNEIGKGASARVWMADCKPLEKKVAVKIMDLELLTCELEVAVRETQVMCDQKHPNVLPMLCCFVNANQLWMVMPYVAGGSLQSLIRKNYPEGLDEIAIATIGRDVLKGLEYLHNHHRIHRDLKAANILVNYDGNVVIGDFGVTAILEPAEPDPNSSFSDASSNGDASSCSSCSPHIPAGVPGLPMSVAGAQLTSMRKRHSMQQYLARNTFCGTPCFMAPEVMEQMGGYDTAADVWSFGILLVELALGRAPYANMSVTSVILTTLRDEPPTLDTISNASQRWSEDLRDVVRQCLVKDPEARPTANEILQHKFWKLAEDSAYLQHYLLQDKGVAMAFRSRLKAIKASLRSGLPLASHPKETFSSYAITTLSGDVANALSLLRRLTSPSSSKHRKGLLISRLELQRCQGVAFCILHKTPNGAYNLGKGNGFVIAKKGVAGNDDEVWGDGTLKITTLKQPAIAIGKGHMRTQTSVSNFSKGAMVEDASPTIWHRWTPPCYFDISVGGLGRSWGYDTVEAIVLLQDRQAVDAFREGDEVLDRVLRDSHQHLSGYGVTKDGAVKLDIAGGTLRVNNDANTRAYAHRVDPCMLMDGEVRSPHEFGALFKMLTSLSSSTHAPGAVLSNVENRGSTLLYRMPMWVYDG